MKLTPKEPMLNYLVMENKNFKILLQNGFNTIEREQGFMLTVDFDEREKTRHIFFDRKDLISLRSAIDCALRDLQPPEQS
jgi:hypothetical protein